jgi:hypothetical protein
MGEGGVGLARRDYDALAAGRNPGIAGFAPGPSQSLLAAPAGAPAAGRAAEDSTGIYALRGVYFNPTQFSSTADCLTAASAQHLPLDLCR